MEQGGVVITGYNGLDPEITIPRVIQGRPVIAIAHEAFNGQKSIRSVVLPDSVREIREHAFAHSSLETITMRESLVRICRTALHSTRLKTISIPASVSDMIGGLWCFIGSSELEAVNVDPANATYSGVDGLLYNKSITTLLGCPPGKKGTVVIPSTVKKINGFAFNECNKLDKIVVPESVTDIDENAFTACSAERIKGK